MTITIDINKIPETTTINILQSILRLWKFESDMLKLFGGDESHLAYIADDLLTEWLHLTEIENTWTEKELDNFFDELFKLEQKDFEDKNYLLAFFQGFNDKSHIEL